MVAPLGELHDDGIVGAFGGVVLRQFQAKPSGLYADGRIRLRIEVCVTAIDPGWDLVSLEGGVGMIKRLLRQILQQLAERFRTSEAMTFNNVIYLLEELLRPRGDHACHSHLTLT